MLCQGHQSPTGTLHDGQTRIKIDGKPAYHMAGVSCFSELAVIHEEQLLCISPKVPLDRAALVGCSVMTGYGAAVNTAGIKPGDDTCIIGCGGVGLNIIQGARALSASKIIGIDILDNKLDYAMEFGATHVINAKEVQDVVAEVLRITEGKGVDYAFDAIGSARTVENCFNMVKTGGTAIEVGIARGFFFLCWVAGFRCLLTQTSNSQPRPKPLPSRHLPSLSKKRP
jgi:Zn-dependent alcohol dehydrogenase